jgi:HEPN domain-containing protein
MLNSGINLGGEPSGHLIFLDISPAGDGIITLLEVLRLLAETRQPLAELVSDLKQFPQIIRNVRVQRKPPLEAIPERLLVRGEALRATERVALEAVREHRQVFGFHAQQAVEKSLKAWLSDHDIVYPRRHTLHTLTQQLAENGCELPTGFHALLCLSPFAARLRYEFWEPTGGPLDRVELARLAEELLVFVKEQTGLT